MGDEVGVIENEDERCRHLQLVVEPSESLRRRPGADVAGDAQESCVGHDGVERGQDAAEQADRVVVTAVERQPCSRIVQAVGPSAQQRRLSVSGTTDDEHRRTAHTIESLQETFATEGGFVRARRSEPVSATPSCAGVVGSGALIWLGSGRGHTGGADRAELP